MIFSPFFFIAISIGALGVMLYWPARTARKKEQAVESWPVTEGAVDGVDVEPQTGAGAGNELFAITVRYHFRAHGQMRFGSALYPQRQLFDREAVQEIKERYAPGAAVKVHFNLDDPQETFLEIPPSKQYKTMTIGLGMIVVGIVTALVSFLM